ncbi:precorrin-6y C5,15-methyltransferase (decarboxylating) subunit CbiE [Methanobacterium spitsbergense]|uniref:Precorrin-6y C5,15-methyltransferase (Decarboxylating) subunit CbiE n=1 Tax=Methanobacterium spitsbergense TaxID=2874285 RepID=A0A8T5UMS5_9EURY|nr:precorrin-6y C5,15-methyltransferase (decarboxylating) subunit CbiE [Methanobacterium spitsbergense]MBZ2165138.1 precorrin-6y C5,15-methyltransferase (decarboxylating) subunit CbiE [Methanobacterium spitsbergense]
MSKLYLVGVGPGSEKYLTFEALNVVGSSDILMGSKRALKLFPDTKAEKIELNAKNMGEMLNLAVSKACEGRAVALLSTGDPGFSGVLKPIKKLAGKLEFEVIPGISSIQICASKLQISWDEANIITMHGKGISGELISLLSNGRTTIILPNNTIEETVEYLLDQGIDPNRRAAVCENLSYENEKIVEVQLKELLNEQFGYMCVLVVY